MTKIKGIRAKIYFLTTEEGGRRTPVWSGYRPGIFWDGLEERGGNDGQMYLDDRSQCFPGDECVARIEFYHPEFLPDLVAPHTTFTVREGQVVGKGVVLEVYYSS